MKTLIIALTSVLVLQLQSVLAASAEEEARFSAAVKQAFEKHDAGALVALTCWERVPEKLKKDARRQYKGIITETVTEIVLLNPEASMLEWKADSDRRLVEIGPAWKETGLAYGPNLSIVKELRLTFSPTKSDDGTSCSEVEEFPIGEKEGKLYFIEPAPAGKLGIARPVETKVSGIRSYVFEPNPQEIEPKMYNWEISLSAADSTNGSYEIIQVTQPLGANGANHATTKVLVGGLSLTGRETIRPNDEGIINFMLYVGDKEPKQNMNGPGNLGQPLVFAGKGTGVGESDWIVLPGSKIERAIPAAKGTPMTEGKLRIIQFIATKDDGERIQADVILQRK